jgi:hypothetical protein
MSEIRVRTYNLPLATYPDTLNQAARLLDQKDTEKAKTAFVDGDIHHRAGQFDWIFASSHTQGKRPYWGAPIMRKKIKPVARKCGIPRLQGWHTFRHTYASLLHELGTNLKIVQELMRHRTIRTTLDGYVRAVTPSKRKAQKALLSGFAYCEDEALSEWREMKVQLRKGISCEGFALTISQVGDAVGPILDLFGPSLGVSLNVTF